MLVCLRPQHTQSFRKIGVFQHRSSFFFAQTNSKAARIPKGARAHGGLQKAGRSVGKMEISDWLNLPFSANQPSKLENYTDMYDETCFIRILDPETWFFHILDPETWVFHISPRPAISPKTRSVGSAWLPFGIRAALDFPTPDSRLELIHPATTRRHLGIGGPGRTAFFL